MSTAVQMELEHNNTNSNNSGPETTLNDQIDQGETCQKSKELNNCHPVNYSDCPEKATENLLKQNDVWSEKSTSEEPKLIIEGPQTQSNTDTVDQESADYFKNQGNEHLKSNYMYK